MITAVRRVSPASLRQAAEILRSGGLVVFPTETVYGLGARALDPKAARRVYRAKGRPADNPLIVHVLDAAMMKDVVHHATPLAKKLMDVFWPGPLTLILDKAPAIPNSVTAGAKTVAVRCPSHRGARALLRALGEPIAAPSANRSGRPSPTTAAHALGELGGRVPLILDGGACRAGLESAIVDARGRNPVLLRPGTISSERIARAAKTPVQAPGGSVPPAPGTKHRHYAPSCRVRLVSAGNLLGGALPGFDPRRDGLLRRSPWTGRAPRFDRHVAGGIANYARAVFSALHEAQAAQVRTLFAESVPERGAGGAVMDRLRRAARKI